MSKLKWILSALALSAGVASAAVPTFVTGLSNQVKVASSFLASGTSPVEGPEVFFVEMTGTYYIGVLNSAKAREQLDLAQHALAAGKKISVVYDPDYSLGYSRCVDWATNGCTSAAVPTPYPVILEIAISP